MLLLPVLREPAEVPEVLLPVVRVSPVALWPPVLVREEDPCVPVLVREEVLWLPVLPVLRAPPEVLETPPRV